MTQLVVTSSKKVMQAMPSVHSNVNDANSPELLICFFFHGTISCCVALAGKAFFGDDRSRTGGLMRAKHAFYRLNYIPPP